MALPLRELLDLNQAYQVADYNPQLFLFGADGYGEAFAFVLGTETVVKAPLIPIPRGEAEIVANGFKEFMYCLSAGGPSPAVESGNVGLELHLKQPLCFGGDFRVSENLVLVPPAKHAELARYWNRLYYDLTNESND